MNELSIDILKESPAIYQAMKTSLYPGASDESILMVLNYCKAAKLDPMLKPVHLVSMQVSTGKKDAKGYDIKEKRDIVMPGINLYRVIASRSGCAGISEPEFGEDVRENFSGTEVIYPKWCRITVKRIIAGEIVEFTAREYWKENYAMGYQTTAPNAMWKKRPYGQLAKCTEAQALRKAFPEIGSVPTADEMEGKHLEQQEYEEIKNTKIIPGKGVDGLKSKLGMTVELETGEISDGEMSNGDIGDDKGKSSGQPKVDDVKSLINNATSIDELIVAADVARSLSEEERKIVRVFYKKKEAELSFPKDFK